MDNKVVFFDIDGTLLDHDKKLPESTKNAINMLKKQGTKVAIATGRAPFMFADLREELGITTYVSFNGQYVVYEDEVIYRNPLNKHILEQLTSHAEDNNHPIVFMDEKTMKVNVKDHPFVQTSIGSLKVNLPEVDASYYKENDVLQALLFCEEVDEHAYHGQYRDFQFIRWHQMSTDILPNGGSKAEGIKKMLEILGIPREHVYAFGDALNDKEMLEYVGTGIAMGNAVKEIKEIADIVTKPVDQEGIKYGLELVGLL
jgi:Cof subfamily protein (haloacid dehalogenase superfamily)